jgi:hypothetical protein
MMSAALADMDAVMIVARDFGLFVHTNLRPTKSDDRDDELTRFVRVGSFSWSFVSYD